MSDEGRTETIAVALALSVALHAALMFFMRPQVMTHVSGADARMRARIAMRVREAQPPEAPPTMDAVADLAPEKEPPDAGAADAPLPETEAYSHAMDALDAAAPEPADAKPPAPPEMTASLSEKMSEPIRAAEGASSSFTMPMSAGAETLFSPASLSAPPPGRAAASPAADDAPPPPPEVSAPVVQAPPPDEEPSAAPGAGAAGSAKEPEPYVPPAEVMAEVDEKIVEEEKDAVRSLLDVRDAAELEKFVDVAPTACQAEGWRYFRVRVTPQPDLKTVPKDVVILIDASGSIANDRLKSCRRAAEEILRTAMNTGDRFNLVAFRDDFDYAFRTWRPCDRESFAAADAWLGKLAAYGRTDVFATISSVLKLPRDPRRPLIALVVTDGDANSGVSATSQILSKFTSLNDGLVSVYMYGVKSSANRELIDVLTHGNRGESFIHEGDRKYAGRSLGELSERFRDPVLSDLRVVFTAASRAEAYPQRLRNLYRGGTVEVCGRVPADVNEVSFSLKGLNGDKAYEGFFRVQLAGVPPELDIATAWAKERAIDAKLRRASAR